MKFTKGFGVVRVTDGKWLEWFACEGESYYSFNEFCKEYLDMDKQEMNDFKNIINESEELGEKLVFGTSLIGKGLYYFKVNHITEFVKKYFESEINKKKLEREIDSLLSDSLEVKAKWSKKEKLIGKLLDVNASDIIYYRNLEPRINVETLSKIYGFPVNMIRQTIKVHIVNNGLPKAYYSKKHDDLSITGLFALQNVTFFSMEYNKDILEAFWEAYSRLNINVYGKLLKKNELRICGDK